MLFVSPAFLTRSAGKPFLANAFCKNWAGFVTLALAYLGTHFVLEYLLHRR